MLWMSTILGYSEVGTTRGYGAIVDPREPPLWALIMWGYVLGAGSMVVLVVPVMPGAHSAPLPSHSPSRRRQALSRLYSGRKRRRRT